jgi:hypothetical protein
LLSDFCDLSAFATLAIYRDSVIQPPTSRHVSIIGQRHGLVETKCLDVVTAAQQLPEAG